MLLYSLFILIAIIYPPRVRCETLGYHNIAEGKPVSASRYAEKYYPWNAVDGNIKTIYHSATAEYNSWRLDLRTVAKIDRIDVINRNGCCWERIDGAIMEVIDGLGNTLETRTFDGAREKYSWNFGDIEAQIVRISLDGDFLSFSDVEVWGVDVKEGLRDMAVGNSLVSSSGHYRDNKASLAVDGSHDTLFHSNIDKGAWWEVAFESIVFIRQITIYNRKDCCKSRLVSATISILDIKGNVVESRMIEKINSDTVTVSFPSNPRGLSVRIDLAEGLLNFSEVEVYGGEDRDRMVNLALNKQAVHYPSFRKAKYSASHAVDGNISKFSHTKKLPNRWSLWEVDLGRNAKIRILNIINRQDCCLHRLTGGNGFVNVLDSDRNLIKNIQINEGEYIEIEEGTKDIIRFNFADIEDIEGRFVKIKVFEEFLHLAEVQVYGYYPETSEA